MMTITAACVTDAYIRNEKLAQAVELTRFPAELERCWGPRMLNRPLFTRTSELQQTSSDLGDLFGLLAALPERLFNGDTAAYCAAIGIGEKRLAMIEKFSSGPPLLFGRADLYNDETGFKILEFNLSSKLGGMDMCEFQSSLLRNPDFATFASRYELRYTHTGERIAHALRVASASITDGRTPRVGVVCAPGEMAVHERMVASFAGTMRRVGVEITIGELGRLSSSHGTLRLNDAPIDVAFRFFSMGDVLMHPEAMKQAELLFRAHHDGVAVLWTPMNYALVSNKGTLALVSAAADSALLSTDERAVIDRLVPWTRILDDDLIDYCRRHREELVLKPLHGAAGVGVTAGWACDERRWTAALRDASAASVPNELDVADRWVVQRRIVPRVETVVDPFTATVQDWVAAWSVFLTPEGDAGAFARVAPASSSPVIGYSINPDVRMAGVFSIGAAR
ncbi:hypothetical protein [Nocardia sp. SC052]|uniref:hypothetical protein n=1 Tax=Nocardia sichangensis TaxID=3385975 RepID=UPI0039A270B3